MTIIREGRRTCSATCHRATHGGCRCICGGRYHGVGNSEIAQELLRQDVMERVAFPDYTVNAVEESTP